MKKFRHWIALLLGACLIIFAFQNIAEVEVQFLFWSFQARRFVILAAACFVGAIMGWVLKSHYVNLQRRAVQPAKSA